MSCRTHLELQAELARIREEAQRHAENKRLLAESFDPRIKSGEERQRWFAIRALSDGLLRIAAFIRQRYQPLLGGLAIGLIAAFGLLLLLAGALGPLD